MNQKLINLQQNSFLLLLILYAQQRGWINTFVQRWEHRHSYPIQYCRPTFHSDTLKYRQHSKADIIEASYTEIRSDPFLHTHTGREIAYIWTCRCYCAIVRVARRFKFTFFNNFICLEILRGWMEFMKLFWCVLFVLTYIF